MDNTVKVFTGGAVTVNLLRTELESIGIIPIVKNLRQSGASAGFPGGLQLLLNYTLVNLKWKRRK